MPEAWSETVRTPQKVPTWSVSWPHDQARPCRPVWPSEDDDCSCGDDDRDSDDGDFDGYSIDADENEWEELQPAIDFSSTCHCQACPYIAIISYVSVILWQSDLRNWNSKFRIWHPLIWLSQIEDKFMKLLQHCGRLSVCLMYYWLCDSTGCPKKLACKQPMGDLSNKERGVPRKKRESGDKGIRSSLLLRSPICCSTRNLKQIKASFLGGHPVCFTIHIYWYSLLAV